MCMHAQKVYLMIYFNVIVTVLQTWSFAKLHMWEV